MQNKSNSQRPSALITSNIVHSNEPASPGHNSHGKPFIIRLQKCIRGPVPIHVPTRQETFANITKER